jgi:hypothetical protein
MSTFTDGDGDEIEFVDRTYKGGVSVKVTQKSNILTATPRKMPREAVVFIENDDIPAVVELLQASYKAPPVKVDCPHCKGDGKVEIRND